MDLPMPMAIDHPTLSVVVAASLRKLISAGRLAPGARLNERQLCDQLKVSRTPLREAYRILSAEGLVELTPKHGARVTELSEDEVANIFDVLAVNEGLAGRLAAEKASPEQLDRIAGLHREMMAAYEERDMARYAVAAKGTHDAVNEAAGNPTLRGIYLRLNAQVQKLRYQANLDDDNWARSIDAHERFVAALLARDAARVESLLRNHVLEKKSLAVGRPPLLSEVAAAPAAVSQAGSGAAGRPHRGTLAATTSMRT
jgi:DNA-binding GntR family transcriptional regulator